MLLKKQKNALFEIAAKCGIDLSQLSTNEDRLSFSIKLENSHFEFKIRDKEPLDQSMQLYPHKIVSIPTVDKYVGWDGSSPWDDVLASFSEWAKSIAEETTTPDLWAEVATQLAADNSPFTISEAKQVQKQLEKLQDEVSTLTISPAEQTVVRQVLAEEGKGLSSLPGKKTFMQTLSTKLSEGLATTLTKPETLAAVAQWIYKALVAAVPTLAATAVVKHFLH